MGPFQFHGGEGTSGELAEVGHTIGLPQEPTGAGGSATAPELLVEVGGSVVCPKIQGERAPLPRSRGRSRNGIALMRQSRGWGFAPQTYLPPDGAEVSH